MFKPTKRYQPERYFMRGPGPKWFEKHGGEIERADTILHHDHTGKDHLLTTLFVQLGEPGYGISRSTPPCAI